MRVGTISYQHNRVTSRYRHTDGGVAVENQPASRKRLLSSLEAYGGGLISSYADAPLVGRAHQICLSMSLNMPT